MSEETPVDATTQNSAAAPAAVVDSLLTAAPEPTAPAEPQTEKDGSAEPVVPEKYEFTLPEGVKMNEQALAQVESIFRKAKLDNATAQEFVTAYSALQQKSVEEQQQAWTNQIGEWVSTVKNDKEVGGPSFTANIQTAMSALARFGTPELKDALNTTGLGNHPELVRFCYRVGKAMGEDTFHHEGQTAAGQLPPEKVLYPNMN